MGDVLFEALMEYRISPPHAARYKTSHRCGALELFFLSALPSPFSAAHLYIRLPHSLNPSTKMRFTLSSALVSVCLLSVVGALPASQRT